MLGLMGCNLLSVVLAKVVSEKFSPHWAYPETLLLALYIGLWGSTYLVRLALWLIVGKRYQLSFIYPVLELNYFFSYLVGIWCFQEAFSWVQIMGLSLICVGVLVITTSPHRLSGGGQGAARG